MSAPSDQAQLAAPPPDGAVATIPLETFSGQRRFLIRMGVFLAATTAVAVALTGPLGHAFAVNPALNGLIIAVLLFGVFYNFRQVLQLGPEIEWIEAFQRDSAGLPAAPPILLAPMAVMLGERQGRLRLSAPATRAILDSVFIRLDESRDNSRYMIGLLIFLGLLGTFWGLIATLSSIGATIQNLSVEGGDITAVFNQMKAGLQTPLSGMGTAFSSSLFGLSGSLVLGFLDLNASQAQNRFYNEFEEWISGLTRLGSGSALSEGETSVPVYITALLEQTADSVERLQNVIARNEDSRAAGNQALMSLATQLATLTDSMQNEQNMLRRLADNQSELRPVLERLARQRETGEGALDIASRQHLRNMDVQLSRLVQDVADGRERALSELRSEIKLLTRTVAGLDGERRKDSS